MRACHTSHSHSCLHGPAHATARAQVEVDLQEHWGVYERIRNNLMVVQHHRRHSYVYSHKDKM